MTNRKPTEELEHEHCIIQQVVGGMVMLIEKPESGKAIDPAVLTDLSEFMQPLETGATMEKKNSIYSSSSRRRTYR